MKLTIFEFAGHTATYKRDTNKGFLHPQIAEGQGEYCIIHEQGCLCNPEKDTIANDHQC